MTSTGLRGTNKSTFLVQDFALRRGGGGLVGNERGAGGWGVGSGGAGWWGGVGGGGKGGGRQMHNGGKRKARRRPSFPRGMKRLAVAKVSGQRGKGAKNGRIFAQSDNKRVELASDGWKRWTVYGSR